MNKRPKMYTIKRGKNFSSMSEEQVREVLDELADDAMGSYEWKDYLEFLLENKSYFGGQVLEDYLYHACIMMYVDSEVEEHNLTFNPNRDWDQLAESIMESEDLEEKPTVIVVDNNSLESDSFHQFDTKEEALEYFNTVENKNDDVFYSHKLTEKEFSNFLSSNYYSLGQLSTDLELWGMNIQKSEGMVEQFPKIKKLYEKEYTFMKKNYPFIKFEELDNYFYGSFEEAFEEMDLGTYWYEMWY